MAISKLWESYIAGLRMRVIWYVRILPLVVSVMAWSLAHDASRRLDTACAYSLTGAIDDRK